MSLSRGHALQLTALILAASTGAARADDFDTGSFGSMPGAATGGDEATVVASKGSDGALAALGELGSFPILVHNGDLAEKTFLGDDAIKSFVPAPTVKKFKLGACAFEIKTGAISARQYDVDAKGKYVVLKDALAQQSTLLASKDTSLYVSVTSELFATPITGSEAACKSMLKDKRKRLGKIDLEETSLALGAAGADRFPSSAVRPATATMVFLVWDETDGGLKLQDKAGLAPSVESPVFELKPQAVSDLYLDVEPKLSVRAKALTAH